MYYYKFIFLIIQILNFCKGEVNLEKNAKLLNGFINFYNNLPNQIYTCEEGTLDYAERVDEDTYKIQVVIKVTEVNNSVTSKHLKCTCKVQDQLDAGVTVLNNEYQCSEQNNKKNDDEEVVTEEYKPVKLDNEVQSDTAATSGEQFIAIPREEPSVPCVGCASQVNPQAAGVTELASLGVRHLDRHESNVKHSLKSVLAVERQVQVVNGVRYILTLLVDYNNCTDTLNELCQSTKTCKISILEKPWVRLSNGGKYRAILSNNCTDSWQFGDNGEILDENSGNNKESNEIDVNNNAGDDNIKVVHTEEVQSLQNNEKSLTNDQIKNIEEQILPHKELVQEDVTVKNQAVEISTITPDKNSVNILKEEVKPSENSAHVKHKKERISLNQDKKKAVDDLINFFNLYEFDSDQLYDRTPRMKRSYEKDLDAVSLAEKYEALQNSLNTGKHLYNLAQTMVDYLNEMDLEVKSRVLNIVIKAEEEIANYQHFFYIQARVIIPCQKVDCNPKDTIAKICNGVIDDTDKGNPRVLNAFCYSEQEKTELNKVKSVPLDDPILLELTKEAAKKIESESSKENAIIIKRIIGANTIKAAGTLTKFTVILNYLNCSKHTPISLRLNCKILEQLGSNVCEMIIHERDLLKQRKITYTCIERPVDGSFSGDRKGKSQNIYDLEVIQMAQEALQYLEMQSNRNNKQKVVSINSVSTKLNAGLLTDIEFIVGYTQCANDIEVDLNACKILPNEPVRKCKAQIWDRTWIEDGRAVDVTCEDNSNANDDNGHRVKRHIPGGLKEQDPNDPRYRQLADESLQKYLQTSGSSKPHRVVNIDKVKTQVVSGKKTYIDFSVTPTSDTSGDIIKCHSEVWEQPWVNKKEIDVNCQIDNQEHRAKRHVPGGLKQQDPNDPRYRQLADESLQKYLQTSGSSKPHRVVNIDKVITQVVSGKKTYIDFSVTPTSDTSGDIIKCHSEVWEQPWVNKKEINVDCKVYKQHNINKRDIIYRKGKDSMIQDPSKRQFRVLAQDSLQEYRRLNKSKFIHKVVEVKRVVTRVVSGMIYDIDFTAVPTTCSRVWNDMSKCKEQANSDLFYCNTNIWSQPWKNKKQIKVSCNPRRKNINVNNSERDNELHSRKKRQAIDDEDYIDEDMRYYYAERAIQQLNQESQTNNLFKLVTIHTTQSSVHMGANMIRMFIEIAPTFCLRHADENDLQNCEEMDGLNHKLCLARMWLSPDDELAIQSVNVVCDDDSNFESVTGLSTTQLLKASLKQLESAHDQKYKLIHLGEPHLVPNLDPNIPTTLSFIVGFTNCTKDVALDRNRYQCFMDEIKGTKPCTSSIWFVPNSREIYQINVNCREQGSRRKRSVPLNAENATADDLEIQKLVQQSLEKLEMASIHKYKQRVLLINSYSTKITTGKVTTIDFDVGYTSCLKYEWIDDVTTCEFLEHLPRRHCVSQIYERLWLQNGKNIEVHCEDDETPLEAHIEFESAEMAMELAKESLKHIEAKYPHPRKQKVVRIFSLDKQVVAGIHYRMKIEVGFTNCTALSATTDCKLVKDEGINRFCRVNVWLRPWTDLPPNYRVSCDYQETATADVYHHIQAEHLFYDFITTYGPNYLNDHNEMRRRFDIFKDNIKRIHELNIHERGTATYGVTRFADLTYEEFSTRYMGLKPSLRNHNEMPMRKAEIPKSDIPEKYDWRDFNTVTDVKDQGSCGSCWAFSVTGNIEGQWKLRTGDLVSLSEQELVDCDKLDQGCNGGLPDNAYRAIEQLGGLELENDYPYEGADDKCVFNKTLSKVQISGAVNISSNETDMAKWLVHNGPISIGINANAMQFYMGGISHPWRMLCSPSNLDHGVLIVGYGIKDYPLFHKRLPYWTIKNSWGKSWGEQGYYRVYRGDGTCGVNQMASSAVI